MDNGVWEGQLEYEIKNVKNVRLTWDSLDVVNCIVYNIKCYVGFLKERHYDYIRTD